MTIPCGEPQVDDLPLAGLRVIALEHAVAAPFCTRQLADLGADVIKIEREGGDFAREYDSALKGTSAYFAWLNRGKRSVCLNLKNDGDLMVVRELVDRADVFVHNLRPGAIERLSLDWETTSARNPRLVWLGISGYGPDGPYSERKAYDFLIQCEAAVVSLTGFSEQPVKVGISVADIASGMYGFSSTLAALLSRHRTGKGQRIELSMLECLVEWVTAPVYSAIGTGRSPLRTGLHHNMIVPYGAYECSDGLIAFSVQTMDEWERFCKVVLDAPRLSSDKRFLTNAERVTNREVLEHLITARIVALTRADAAALFDVAEIAHATVRSVNELVLHPQLQARHRWTSVDSPVGRLPALLPPHNLGGHVPHMKPIPGLGEHTAEVLEELASVRGWRA